VVAGEKLMSLEAMKMESSVTASAHGTITEIYVRPGDQVAPGQPLLAISGAH
jgi:urea carboxylase